MIHTGPAAVGEAADYKTEAGCLHLIVASVFFFVPLLIPPPSFISTEETSGTESDPEDNSKGNTRAHSSAQLEMPFALLSDFMLLWESTNKLGKEISNLS